MNDGYNENSVLNVMDVAKILKISKRKASDFLHSGVVGKRISKRIVRVTYSELLNYLTKQ
jgi:hypothetical protein